MNKKQLIVAWVMGVIISVIIAIIPKISYYQNSYVVYFIREGNVSLAPLTNWSTVLGYSLIILIIGSLLIYTFGDKKK